MGVGGFYLCYTLFMKYVFILGHNPKLSVAEVKAVFPAGQVVEQTSSFLILDTAEFDGDQIMDQLGGTIKIGQVLADKIDKKLIVKDLQQHHAGSKLNFGFSYYEAKKDNLGMDVKTALKKVGLNSRLVISKEKNLSSVVITKNKVVEYLVLSASDRPSRDGRKYLARTIAVQGFEGYSKRDFGRPARDMKSGSMPPKLAKIMINLAQVDKAAKIHDAFCGSGTMLQEALLMGYTNISGSDKSSKAIEDTKKNLVWLADTLKINTSGVKVFLHDVINLSDKLSEIDAIVSEPLLGPPLRGHESPQEIKRIVRDLEELYLAAFEQFIKILNPGGKVVMIFPSFMVDKNIYRLNIEEQIKNLGFTQEDDGKLIYFREGQKVYRNIKIFSLSSRP